jgi:hypothetical protein
MQEPHDSIDLKNYSFGRDVGFHLIKYCTVDQNLHVDVDRVQLQNSVTALATNANPP